MPKHARPPDDDDLPPGVVEATPARAASAKRGPKPRILLPDDDPFVLIGMIDETGGIKGDNGRSMNHVQGRAFRVLCMMPPSHRSLARLSARLETEWGKAPNRKSLERWSSDFGWQKLLKLYDEAYDRYTLYKLEQDKQEARRRHANVGRAMIRLAAKGITEELLANESAVDEEINPRTGKPYKKKSGRSLQGLAFTVKVGMEMERLALGLPSTITDQRTMVDSHTESLNVTMSLDEWRRASRVSRVDDEPLALAQREQQKALPAPAKDKPWLRHVDDPAVIDELPADWFEEGDTPPPAATAPQRVVDADPTPEGTP